MIYEKGKLTALFVANEKDRKIQSHGGLSYGGLVLPTNIRLTEALSFFYHVVKYYASAFDTITYKCFPSYLATFPSQEDLYALFRMDAKLIRRDTSSVWKKGQSLAYHHGREQSIRKASAAGFQIEAVSSPVEFWSEVLTPNLQEKFGASPVHSADEMKMLMELFPDNIKLHVVKGERLLGGTLVFVMPNAVHTQYISATAEGKELGALDYLMDHLIHTAYADRSVFSFGTSNGKDGSTLNEGLVSWKEGFGARTHVIDTYEIQTSQHSLLKDYE